MKKIVIEFALHGHVLGPQAIAEKIKKDILDILQDGNTVICDFADVHQISDAFARTCFGKLLEAYPIEVLRARVLFRHASPFLRTPIYQAYETAKPST